MSRCSVICDKLYVRVWLNWHFFREWSNNQTVTMSDLFKREDVVSLLRGKTVLLLGGSIMRGHYKDIIWLINSDTLINRGVSCKSYICYENVISHSNSHLRFWGIKQRSVSLSSRARECPLAIKKRRTSWKKFLIQKTETISITVATARMILQVNSHI